MIRIREAGAFGAWLLSRCGFVGITSPWRTIYIAPGHMDDAALMRHEIAHLGQMRRDGWLRFWFFISVWFVWPGYERSHYEVEARKAEADPRHPLITWADHWSIEKEN